MTNANNFTSEWHRLAASDESRRIRKIATRLCEEPLASRFFPYASHDDLHVSRSETYPWDDTGLPFISSRADDAALYQARDGEFRSIVEGDLETVARAFVALLASASDH